jgi:hypothetical protein
MLGFQVNGLKTEKYRDVFVKIQLIIYLGKLWYPFV